MSELDWGGEKHTVTINNTLSGCSADKSGTQQVSEGSTLVVTVTADSGKLLRSVSASSGTVVIAANKTSATVTLTVNDDVTLTIQASATNAATFTASINDPSVSGTGATSGITEGSSWTSVLSLNSDDPSDEITNVTVEMAGEGSSISAEEVNGVWTVHTDYVTGNITITATVAGVTKHTLTINTAYMSGCHIEYNGNEMTPTSNVVTIGNITDGSNVSFRVVPNIGCTLQSLSYTVDGTSQEDQNIDGTGETISISNVTSDMTVVVTATTSTTNYLFKNTRFYNGNICLIKDGVDSGSAQLKNKTVLSPIIDIEGKNNLVFNLGADTSGTACVVRYFNDKLGHEYAGSKTLDNNVPGNPYGDLSNAKAIRLEIPKAPQTVYGTWVKNGDNYLFNGQDFVDYDSTNETYTFKSSNVKGAIDFLHSEYFPRTQEEIDKKVFYGLVPLMNTTSNCQCLYVDPNEKSNKFLTERFPIASGDAVTWYGGSGSGYGLVTSPGSEISGGYKANNTSSPQSPNQNNIGSTGIMMAGLISVLSDAFINVNGTEIWSGASSEEPA